MPFFIGQVVQLKSLLLWNSLLNKAVLTREQMEEEEGEFREYQKGDRGFVVGCGPNMICVIMAKDCDSLKERIENERELDGFYLTLTPDLVEQVPVFV